MERPAAADFVDTTVLEIANDRFQAASARFQLPFALYVGPALHVLSDAGELRDILKRHGEVMRRLGTPLAETRHLGHSVSGSGRVRLRVEVRWHAGDPRIHHALRMKVFVIGEGEDRRVEMVEIDPRDLPSGILDCLSPGRAAGARGRRPVRSN